MKVLLLFENVEKKIIRPMHFKNKEQAINWVEGHPLSEEWVNVYKRVRKKTGHRYELMYSKFDEEGKLCSRYIICFSKKEAVILTGRIKEANPNYITNIKRLY